MPRTPSPVRRRVRRADGSLPDIADAAGVLGLGALAAFGLLTMLVISRAGAPLGPDRTLLAAVVRHRPPALTAAVRGLADTGTGLVPYAVIAVAALLAGRTPRRGLAVCALGWAGLSSGQAVRYCATLFVRRDRPPRAAWAAHASGYAFPSGHTTTAVLTAGFLIGLVLVMRPRAHPVVVAGLGLWALLIGATRIYLGVHWMTDVVGGWLLALGWSNLWLCGLSWWCVRHGTPLGADRREPAEEPG